MLPVYIIVQKTQDILKKMNAMFSNLQTNNLAKFSESDQIIIGGDFNDSRIGTKADLTVQDRKDLNFLQEGYELDTFTTHRSNENFSLNSYGEQMIQLCIASKLRGLILKDILLTLDIRLQPSGLNFGFRKHFPNKLDTAPFSTNLYDIFRPQAHTT